MSDEHASATRVSPAIVAGGLVGLTVFYVLSPLPALFVLERLAGDSTALWSLFETIYTPLSWLCVRCQPVEAFYDWYLGLLDL